jgi:hypothetical protein
LVVVTVRAVGEREHGVRVATGRVSDLRSAPGGIAKPSLRAMGSNNRRAIARPSGVMMSP